MTDSDVKLGNNSVNKVCLGSQQMLGGNPNTFRITTNCKRNWIYNKQDGEMDFVMCQFVNVAHGEQFVEINDYYYSNLYVGTIFD